MKALFYTIFGATAATTLIGYVALDLYAENLTSKSLITKETYKKIFCKQMIWSLKNWKMYASDEHSDEYKKMVSQNNLAEIIEDTLLNG